VIPQAFPMLKPFRQAVDYQLNRVPGARKDFQTLSNEAKLRGFWVAGLERRDLIEAAYREATAFIAEGRTKQEFLDHLGEILDKQGGTLLSSTRLELIAQNAFAVPYAAGRFSQLDDPDIVSERPYLQYPLGPHDSHTSQICLALEGFVARYDDPVWKRIFPPNHHHERHLQVVSLTAQQAEETGKVYASPAGGQYPMIEGQTILPDPGWDFSPGLLTADDRALVQAAQAIGAELPAKVAADYGLESLDEVGADELPEMPALMPRVTDGADPAELAGAWQRFQDLFSIPEGETGTLLTDVFGDGVRVNRDTFKYMARGGSDDRASLFPLLRPAIEDPFEVWIVARQRVDETVFHKRYFGLFRDKAQKKAVLVILDETPEGWLWQLKNAFRDSDWAHLENQRAGRLLLSKARRIK
jgi:hypothetical protein